MQAMQYPIYRPDDINSEFLNSHLPNLSEHEANGLEGMLTIDEVRQALRNRRKKQMPRY